MGSCIDLRKFQTDNAIEDAFSKLVSGGRYGYKTVIVKDKPVVKCENCTTILSGEEKFCPECGSKVKKEDSVNL